MMIKKTAILIAGILSLGLHARWSPQANDPYGTHQPVLHAIASNTRGAIIEFGCGHGSTDILHEICKKDKRILISIEDNLAWINIFRKKYLGDGYTEDNSGWHKFIFVSGKKDPSDASHWINFLNTCELLQNIEIDLCFIDQDPFLARAVTLMLFKDRARYVILHDCDAFATGDYKDYTPTERFIGKEIQPINRSNNTPGIYDFSGMFRHFKVYFPCRPWPCPTGPPTLLGSNFESDLPDVDFEKY